MWICPVCDTENHTPICAECGFDHSADLTSFPTLGLVSPVPPAPSALREDRAVLRCSHCGGSAFSFRLKQRSFFCLGCRTPLPTERLTKLLGAVIEEPRPLAPAAIAAGGFHSVVLRTDGSQPRWLSFVHS